jgi:hypothetical protein
MGDANDNMHITIKIICNGRCKHGMQNRMEEREYGKWIASLRHVFALS